MDPLDLARHSVFALHMLGLAAVVGTFFTQLRRRDDFVLWPLLSGAIVQVATGLALVGMRQATGREIDVAWVVTKLAIAVVVLGAAIAAVIAKGRGARVRPWFHAAGGLAVVDVLVASLWG
jgi:hypothetical protein